MAAALVVIVLVPLSTGEYGIEIGFRLLLYIVLGEAWNLMAGYGGLVSLGTASSVGIGAYVLVGMLNHISPSLPLALTASAVAAAILAAIVSPAVFRLRGLYFTVGTLALGEALRLFMINFNYFGGATGLFLRDDPPSPTGLYIYAAVVFALATIVISIYTRSRLSIALRAVRDDEAAAAQIGVRAFRVKLAAFTVASALMAVAGALQGLHLGTIEPYGTFGLQWSIDAVTIVVVGGMGQRAGAIVGAIVVVALAELLADYPELHVAINGLILIIVIRFAPAGLTGLAKRWWQYRKAAATPFAPAAGNAS
jgi:branched-chain amino acid transport system permease protein